MTPPRDLHPLSYGQRALWFLQKLAPENAAYSLPFVGRLHAAVDGEVLRRGFQALADRHPALRTTYPLLPEGGGAPLQWVHEHLEIDFAEIDAAAWDEEELRREVTAEAHRPIALERPPVVRLRLFRHGPEDCVLLLQLHHIAVDFQSLSLILTDLQELLAAAFAGRPAELPPPAGRYVDFARWQAEMLRGPQGERQWEYWRNELAGELPQLALPTDRPRPRVQSFRGGTCGFSLDADTCAGLARLARLATTEGETAGTSLFTVLVAAFKALLHRASGQDEIVVGSTLPGRPGPEMRDVVGYFVNTVLLRGDLAGDPPFRRLLSREARVVSGAVEHQHLPFPLLVERLAPERDLGRSPLYQVLLAFYEGGAEEQLLRLLTGGAGHVRLGPFDLEPFAVDRRTSMLDLTLNVMAVPGRMELSLQYDADLFDPATAERLTGGLRALLEQVARDPDARLSELPLGRPSESAQVLAAPPGRAVVAQPVPEPDEGEEGDDLQGIAIVGLSLRFPGAASVERFWENLCAGVEAITFFDREELRAAGTEAALLDHPNFVRAAGRIDGADRFDAGFFSYNAREASLIDPQQRIFLECAWEALEDAACDPETFPGPIGVYAGVSASTYLYHLLARRRPGDPVEGLLGQVGNDKDFIATRASYKLGLTGPSFTVQSACSSSLVATHLACQSLLNGECDMALAGGSSIATPQERGHLYSPAGIMSPDGHCRAFDARARGTVGGSGVGVVALKRLEDALADGDRIYAVIRGSAVNNDGPHKAGFTAPSAEGQGRVIAEALAVAGVAARDISYVETHGSGTPLGDTIEVAALTRVFSAVAGPRRCALGSVKTNLGHLDAAAGMAGLIKTALALEHRALPASLHFEEPNPRLRLDEGPFYVNTELTPWPAGRGPRRAGVSAFGLGGTNAHLVLEEAPAAEATTPSRPWQLLLLSARSPGALEAATDRLSAHLEAHPGQDLADVAYTAKLGRRAFQHRRMLVCRDRADACAALARRDPGRLLSGAEEMAGRPVAFAFPGLGEHYPEMGRGLYEQERGFRERMDRCAEILLPLLGTDLRELLYPLRSTARRGAPAGGVDLRAMLGRGGGAEGDERLDRTAFAHPALFAVEYALAGLWMDWGIVPQAVVGYSLGEYAAACVAGVFSLEDALLLVARRARMIEELPAGAMLAVPLAEAALRDLLGPDLDIAAVNGPQVSVVAGPLAAVAELEDRLAAQGLAGRRLRTRHAFHGRLMEPVAERLTRLVAEVPRRPPAIPCLSNVTGTWLRPEEATDPGYWARHLLGTVRFADNAAELWNEPGRILLEVGPGQSLASLALQHPASGAAGAAGPLALPSLAAAYERQEDQATLLTALGRLWLAGVRVDWRRFYAGERRRHTALPTYPFERQRYWFDGVAEGAAAPDAAAPTPAPASTSVHARPNLANVYVAPETDLERGIARLWQELLGVEQVGVHDSFFALGGHSLLATQVISRLIDALGVELSLEQIFAAPTVAELAAVIAAASGVQAAAVPQRPPIPRRPDPGRAPLSFAQQRLWFIDQLAPGSALYNVPVALHVAGPLDARVLALCLGEVARRHETLRTVFALEDGAPVQVIRPAAPFALPAVDLSALPESRREEQILTLTGEEAARPFDLARDPLLRATLLRLAEGEHIVALTLHHIVSDSWSIGILIREIGALYPAFAAGLPASLPELPVQYADYAAWQRSWLQGETLEAELAFWRRQLADLPPLLTLPTDRPRPAHQTFRGALRPVRMPAALIRQAEALGGREGATLFMVLLAAFQALLARLGGQRDVAVGTPIAGRNRVEIEGLIGFFVNTLVLRARLTAAEPSFLELLRQVRETALTAYRHQEVPFEKLVQELTPERRLDHTPLFQVMLVLQNAPAESLEIENLRLRMLSSPGKTAKFDLTLNLTEEHGGLRGEAEHSTDLFDGTTIDRLLGHLERLLAAALAEPEARLAELSLLSPAERHQLLAEWSDTAAPSSPGTLLHRLFAAQAARTPDAPAAVFAGETVTYAALDARAERLAHHLRGLGCGPESRAGVAVERSLDLLVALLGVLKSGAAYVPLDPDYPRERLAFVLEDAAPRVLVTQTHLLPALPPAPGAVLCLDEPGGRLPDGPDRGAPDLADDLQLAYVLYTSGSTGRPKGVGVSHRALVNFLASMRRSPGFSPGERLLAVTSLGFDIAALEIFLPLTTGGCVELASRAEAADGALLAARLRASGAAVLQATPATWRLLLDSGWSGDPGLRALCGGEALPRDLAAALAARTGELWNLYGPTETTVWSAAARIRPEEAGPVSIGRPIANTGIHLLDEELRAVPLGVPGELWIGGAGLARGYLGRPDLTAERFLPDPSSGEPGGRLYRTGDLARHLPGGRMEVLGRIDHQVKIRGFRIELGEIEAVLGEQAGVREAVVVAREGRSAGAGDRRLVAYVAADAAAGPAAESVLRRALQERLPDYMVPAAFVLLSALPRTPNGKVDRKALPAPGWQPAQDGSLAPRTPAEELLAGIWAEVLGVERVGVEDSFFDLGGHSLLATRVLSRLRSVCGVELPVRALFEKPTVAQLSAAVEAARRGEGGPAPSLVPVPRTGDLLLSFAQERLWFLDQLEPGGTAYNLPLAVRLAGRLDPGALAAAYGAVLRRHEALRTTFAEVDGRPVQRISPPAAAAVPVVDLSALGAAVRPAFAARLAEAEARRPFDLARGPLARLTVLRLGPAEHLAVLAMHHIVTDGWSVGVLLRDLAGLYAAAVQGAPATLPELPVQPADHAVWQRGRLRDEAVAAELAWWRGQLAGAPPHLELPFAGRRAARGGGRAGLAQTALSPERTAALEAFSRRQGATPFMTLLAGWSALLSRYTAQEDVLIGAPVAGRTHLETEALVGFFANTLVLRTDLSGAPGGGELVERVRRATLAAYDHQELPFERLVQELQPERHLARSPLVQVFFALQNAPQAAFELPDLRMDLLPLLQESAKVDLSLAAERRDEGLSAALEYRRDLCDAATADRLLEHWRNLLDGLLAHPEVRVAELPLLGAAERRQLVIEWNDSRTAWPRAATIQELFEAQVAAAPEAPALLEEGVSWTYAELNARANRLAHHLRRLGVGPEVLVGVCLERSAELTAALLGVLKAGGAYVPLDPSHPVERLRFLRDDSGVRLLVSREELAAELGAGDIPCLFLDRDADVLARQRAENPPPCATAGNLAYVMYTSGSTGLPKGVAVPHRGVVRLVRETGYVRLGPAETFLQLAPASFDASTFEIWGALLNGARLAVLPGRVPSLDELGAALARHGVTTLWLTAGLFHQMVDERLPALAGVRQLLAGGDVLSPAHVRRVLTELPGCAVINGYGPTENTTFTCCRLLREPGEAGDTVPLGRPIANTRVHLLDRALQPVPVGVPGELCAGGDGLARGYLGRPALTAERFVPDPFAAENGEPGGRLYRTGDLARRRADGEIEFLGRIDQQVKIRGFRIEPGEVEAALVRHPDVLEAVVQAREVAGARALVAWVLCADVRPAAADLREHLRASLPEPMIPAAFVVLRELPLTPNGKVDRRALPDPERAPTPAEAALPRTPVEEVLAGLWAEVLGLRQVGRHDGFFDLGGHSLLATQVVARLRGALGVELPLRTLFERPTVAELAPAVEEALRGGAELAAPPLVPVPRTGDLPLSFAQERLWFLDRLQPESSAYNLPLALELRGALSLPVLAASLDAIAARHEALRTTFRLAGSQPSQVIAPAGRIEPARVDLEGLPEALRAAEAARLAHAEALRPFDLARGPLVRATLLRLGSTRHIALFNQHHIVSDGWSMGVLVDELAALYGALAAGEVPALPDLPVQVADHAVWQRRWLRGEVLDRLLLWWRDRLAGAPHVLDLPTDQPRPATRSLRGARATFDLSPELSAGLRELSRREGATLFMTLAALLATLLSRQTGADDLLLGSPIAGRSRAETERLIGLFVNTLVLRAEMTGDPAFRDLLGRMREMALGAYAHQDLPFEKLVDSLQPERSLAHTPLFQVMLVLQNTPVGTLELPGLTLAPLPAGQGATKVDLLLSTGEDAGRLTGSLEHDRDLFDAATVTRLLGHLRILAEGAVRHPQARLSALPLLSAPEIHQLRHEWNDTAAPRPAGALLHELFAARAAVAPQAPALVYEDRTLTYAELDRLADRLAQRLRALGVGPDVAVGVLMERSAEMMVALLGILKAGGGYLPLDPDYPGERLAGMAEEARIPVLLAQERLLPVLPAAEARVLLLEAGWDGSGADGGGAALPAVSEASLAYVLYTSGSTGRPKGVMIPHRGIVNRLLWMQEAYGLTPGDRVLQKTPFSFDVSVWELFWPLITGACLVMARPGGHRDAAYLAALIERERVTVAHFVPSMLQAFLGRPDLSGCAGLRLVVASGEALSPELRQSFRERLPARLENLYGPTEASVDVTAWSCAATARGGIVPIGRPVANTGIHLLDRAFRPVPIGVAGELCIAGVQLARGYWRQPDLTAERFVPAPGGPAGERLYRTGDLARHLPDGVVEFLGRIDHQVKIRGFRIEPGEIEAALARHPGVRRTVVLARSGQLIAYFTPAAKSVATAELRAHLRRSLPDHMVPAAFVSLPELPLTASGKVDRRALPAPQRESAQAGGLPPRNRLEEALAGIWAEVLAVDHVGIHDNFFEVGGHSLRIVEVQAGIRRVLGREVPVVELFRHPTIAALAAFLGGAAPEAPRPAAAGRTAGTDIAILAVEGRFPGAPDVERFWDNLRDGVESIARLSDEQLLAAGLDPADLERPDLVRAAALLAGMDLFDASFFGFNPREAQALDPQQRVFLEHAWVCLERAGYDPARTAGRIGVFAGSGLGTYAFNVLSDTEMCEALDPLAIQTAIDKDYLATRVSYKLGLRGPAVSVQTACSTSLVAIHLARQSLLAGECDMALAGGVTLKIRQEAGYRYVQGGIASPDGHCRAFDAAAQGTVFGSGAGVVLLKRLDEALRDGDPILAVLKGSSINNDGALKVGYTAPSVDGQAEVVAAALDAAGVSPDSITYVEAHGTATALGDPIEVAALTQAFRRGTDRTGYCSLGSVKTNIGHLDAAAGVAGLIKAVLALEHRQIPPSLHFRSPNPAIDFAASPFRVADRLADWRADGAPRRAGVSSFGIGGTNAHAVLEEAPPPEPSGPSRPFQLLLLSARTPAALEEATSRLALWLERHPEVPLADVAHTLRVGRHRFEHRRMLVCASRDEALAALRGQDPERLLTHRQESGPPAVAWLLPGQGSQHPGMGRDLYASEPVFRREVDACADRLAPRLGRDLREILFASSGAELAQTRFAQPALFVVEHALARLWLSWELRPQALLGHSLGEYVAACLAGVLSLDDALTLVAARGELMQELPPGAMLSVDLAEDDARAEIAAAPGLSLAAVNAPGHCVIAGPAAAVDALAERLARRAVPCRRLHTSHAFHSEMMEPILGRFAEIVARVELRPPSIPWLSNLTGTWITAEEATDPRYWVRHLRETVRFGDGVSRLLAELPPGSVLLETGPGRALGRLVRGQAAGRTVLASLPHPESPESGAAALLHVVGRLWLAGVEIDWQAFQGEERRRRVLLPTYPFQRQRFWVEAPRQGLATLPAAIDPRQLADLGGLLRDPGNAEVLKRLLEAEPDLRLLLPRPAEAGAAVERGAGSAPPEPASGSRRPDLPTPYQEPRSEIERRLAAIWSHLLGIDRVGVHDDFFELGGHSLLATRLLSRIREEIGGEIPLEALFAAPTVARLAAHLATGGEPPVPQAAPILPVPRGGDLPLSFAQQRLLFLAVMDSGDPSYNLPIGLRLDGRLDVGGLRRALDALVARHEPLRTTFRIQESRVSQVIAPAAGLPLPLADLAGLPAALREAEGRRLALEQARHPFDLLRGPVAVALLVRLAPAEHLLLLTVHHIAADGWSCSVLYRDLTELYRATAEGRRAGLPELAVQYADFAAWQRSGPREEEIERHLDYWRTHLAGARAAALPTDRPRPRHPSGRGATLLRVLPAATVGAAHRLARAEDATLFMVLLGAFAVVLHRATGSDDLVIGTDIANRNRRETENLIGLFVNQLVLRNDLSGDPTFRELVRRVRRITLKAYTHQDAPFDRLVEALNPVRDLGTTPLFQVKLVLQNARMPVHELTELQVAPFEMHNQTAKFDLLLNLAETGDAVSCALEYSADLWDEGSMERLLGDFAAALAAGTSQPDERLGRIEEELSRSSAPPAEARRTLLRRRAISVSQE